MLIITDNLNEWSMLQKAIDFLKESLVKDEDCEEPIYITKADAPLLILEQEDYDTLQNIDMEWHLPGYVGL